MERIGLGKIANQENYVNKLFSYVRENAGEISLHVGIDDESEGDYTTGDKMRLMRQGLARVAAMLVLQSELKEVEKISATSWIVTKNPKLMEALGFTIDDSSPDAMRMKNKYKGHVKMRKSNVRKEHRDIEPSYAYITKDKFLELYNPERTKHEVI